MEDSLSTFLSVIALPPNLTSLIEESYYDHRRWLNPSNYDLLLLSFPIQEVEVPFKMPPRGAKLVWCDPDLTWNHVINPQSTPNELTTIFNCQIKNNNLLFEQLHAQCIYSDELPGLRSMQFIDLPDGEIDMRILKDYYVTEEKKLEQCKVYENRRQGYMDTFSRDDDVLNKSPMWDSPTHVMVALKPNLEGILEYFGHIYVWVSPVDPSICIAQGIRNRVDSAFLGDDNVKGLSKYLFEGVRRFAEDHGCSRIIVPNPLPTMKSILLKMGFQPTTINKNVFGKSLAYMHPSPFDTRCDNCVQLSVYDSKTVSVGNRSPEPSELTSKYQLRHIYWRVDI